MADKNDFSEIPNDICSSSALVTCQSSKTLHKITETIRSTLQKSFDEDESLSDEEKKQIKERFWEMFQSAIQENTSVDGEKWCGTRRDTQDFSPVDNQLIQSLNSDLPQRTNEAITTLSQKRKTIPTLISSTNAKRLKIRRRYLENVPHEVSKKKEVAPPVGDDDTLITTSQKSCNVLGELMQKITTTSEEANLVNLLFKTETETKSSRDDVTTRARRPSAKSSKSQNKKQPNDDHQNLIRDLMVAPPGANSMNNSGSEKLRRRKNKS